MTKIPLRVWADKNGISLRTAQIWAKKGKLATTKAFQDVVMSRKILVYMIENNARIPRDCK